MQNEQATKGKPTLEINDSLEAVLRFMQETIPTDRLVSVAKGGLLWLRFCGDAMKRERSNPALCGDAMKRERSNPALLAFDYSV